MTGVRVFYDHQATSLQDAGGISRYFHELVRALLEIGGVQPDLLLGWERSVLPFRELAPPARVWRAPSPLRPGHARYAVNEAIGALVAPLLGAFDVYHATYQRRVPWVRGRALVVTHHDSAPARYPALFRNAASIHARLDRLYARADRILCVSEASRRDLLHFHRIDPAKTEVVHHGFSPLLGVPEAIALPFPGRPFLLYVGTRYAYKNFPVALQALARQRDRSLCLLTLGGGEFSAEEERAIASFGLEGRVHLVPRATDGQLAWAYRHADLFLYPSLYEGFGLPPLEAMHAGCPAVVSRTSALPEICGDAAFYFDPASIEELVTLLDSLRGDASFRLSRQAPGRALAASYSWRKCAEATLAAYRQAVESARG